MQVETTPMPYRGRSITWQGRAFHFERMQPIEAGGDVVMWAVSRGGEFRGEFIGTMPCSPEVTTKEFEVRGLRWLGELLGPPVDPTV
jgi:hypothetical protein